MLRRVSAVIAGVGSAAWPLIALAEGPEGNAVSRAMAPTGGSGSVMMIAVGALLGLFGVTALGYLYRRQRNLDWTFQQPDAPHDAHH